MQSSTFSEWELTNCKDTATLPTAMQHGTSAVRQLFVVQPCKSTNCNAEWDFPQDENANCQTCTAYAVWLLLTVLQLSYVLPPLPG
jgi:hypothetical protein